MRTIYGEYQLFTGRCLSGCQFEEAAAVCEGEGGHLPFIQSQEENEEVKVNKTWEIGFRKNLTFSEYFIIDCSECLDWSH